MTQIYKQPKAVKVHAGDLPAGVKFKGWVAVDTETQGLNLGRDRLCLIQLSAGDGVCHLVQFPAADYAAPNLKKLLTDPKVTKTFHFARFDVAIIKRWLGVVCGPVYCTKIASKLVRTYTDRHGLKDVTAELLGIDLSKAQQSSDWAAKKLSKSQIAYAAADVLNLLAIQAKLNAMLVREGRAELAKACFEFLPTRAELDLTGWPESDIFSHS
ncbi:MAG: ribonuclease H-like domain-containing protein [Proteobacteria bacterium]|nr:ribonuclease H-like domain-containing protein [Pseudomonadota bacterium]